MFKEFFKKYKKETRKNKLLNAKLILLNECEILYKEINKNYDKNKFNKCMELITIIDDLNEYYEKIEKEQ